MDVPSLGVPTERIGTSEGVLSDSRAHVARQEGSSILLFPTAPLVRYGLRTRNAYDKQFNGRFELVLQKEKIYLPLAWFIHDAWYDILYSREGDQRIT